MELGTQLNNGQFHEVGFDWRVLGKSGRVEFYVDGLLVASVDEHVPDIAGRVWVGLWFPSGQGAYWAGTHAQF